MKLKMTSALLSIALITIAAGYELHHGSANSSLNGTEQQSISESSANDARVSRANVATLRYRIDGSQSNFIAHALPGGLLWFMGHEHLVAVREFSGEAQLTPDSITPASLEITAKTASMLETSSVFTEQQKQIIDKELREIVLLPDKYPEIVFKSSAVKGKATGSNRYDLKIAGDLTLNGVTRQITIPTQVTVTGNDLSARGEFSIDRSDFNVKATSAVHGLVRVRNKIKFTFEILGHQL